MQPRTTTFLNFGSSCHDCVAQYTGNEMIDHSHTTAAFLVFVIGTHAGIIYLFVLMDQWLDVSTI